MATCPPSAVIVGAGPAGLTAALELLRNSDVAPLVVEASDTVGGSPEP
jgi:protoporphyrinogen oxidase